MADDHASTSDRDRDARSTTKRKMVSTSDHESGDSVFSPPGKRYKLRTTTQQGCFFSGNPLSENEMSTSGTRCTVRGPATSYWVPAQINRLNFQKPVTQTIEGTWTSILRFMCEPYTPSDTPDWKELPGPEILTTTMKNKVMEACTGSPGIQYMEEVFTYLRENGFRWDHNALLNRSEQIAKMETCLEEKITENQKSSNLPRKILLRHIKECLCKALVLCSNDKKPERDLDNMMVLVMQLAHQQFEHNYFSISQTGQTEVKFEICGSLVTSMTNILWEVKYRGKLTAEGLPVLMCENKGSYIEGETEAKQTGKKKTSLHMKLPQVIGQCVSMADKSIFETKDYKIVYHVSLMSTHKLVITRTHVAKSTLKVIKESCPIPEKNDLDPSYVFEASLYIHNDWEYLIKYLYTTLQVFEKIGFMLVFEEPEAE